MDAQVAIPSGLLAATNALGESLTRRELILAFKEAQARLDVDERSRALLDRMAEADADLRRRKAEGTLTRADIDRVRDVHSEASLDPSIKGFGEAQYATAGYLLEVNLLISELLGWDFAAMAAGPANC